MAENIGFVSTRFAGTDGVSLESEKWAQILSENGEHHIFWYAGRVEHDSAVSLCIPEAYFGHPENDWINEQIWGRPYRSPLTTQRIKDLTEYLKTTLYDFVDQFDISFLILQNVLAIPMHIPLGLALTEFLTETRIPTIAHHHDFYWERTRFLINGVSDYLDMAFPPRNTDIQHAVINQTAQEELSWRKGLASTLIPNVLDFDRPPPSIDAYSSDVRAEIGLTPDDLMILQPTRIVPRKGIEHAVKLVEMLGDSRYKLVISHEAGDEGYEYRNMLSDMAQEEGVDLRFVSTRIGDVRQVNSEGKKVYTLWDLYAHADLVTYTSLYEGFGNAFLEAIYFRVPVLVNRYSIFVRDIEPKGFRLPVIDGFLTKRVVDQVRRLLSDKKYREEAVNHNYEVAKKFYSYGVLRRKLNALIANLRGT